MPRRHPILALSLVLALTACGGGSGGSGTGGAGTGTSTSPDTHQVSEADLYAPASNPTGAVPRRGAGPVMVLLEPAGGPPMPRVGDTATVGVDEVWFEVTQGASQDLSIDDAGLATASRVEIVDAAGAAVVRVDGAQRASSAALPGGKYTLRLTAAAGLARPSNILVWFGGTAATPNDADVSRLRSQGSCAACDLRGATLSDLTLSGINLSNARLDSALLARIPASSLTLSGNQVFRLILSGASGASLAGANLSGATLNGAILTGTGTSGPNLSGANLSRATARETALDYADLKGANLDHADLTGAGLSSADLAGASLAGTLLTNANLAGANLHAASLAGADLTGAILDGATWPSGYVCAAGSTGVCR